MRLTCAHRVMDDDRFEFLFEVHDTGAGIPAGAHDRLFTRFTQADSSNTRKHGGIGLGLAICKKLVELMGGQIGCRSTLGVGSTFWFTIRGARGHAKPAENAAKTSDLRSVARQHLRVLVAEDNHVNQRLLSMVLGHAGHAVDLAGNGAEAVEAVQRCPYDVVLMDMQMPVMDGPTATVAIRKLAGPAGRIPIIAVTANVLPEHRAQCISSGMNGVLSKPINPHELLAWLDTVTLNPETTAPAELQPRAHTSKSGEASPQLLSTQSEGAAVREFLDAVPGEAVKYLNDLKATIAQKDGLKIQRIGRELQSFVGNSGIAELAELASEIEREAADIDNADELVPKLEVAVREAGLSIRAVA